MLGDSSVVQPVIDNLQSFSLTMFSEFNLRKHTFQVVKSNDFTNEIKSYKMAFFRAFIVIVYRERYNKYFVVLVKKN